MGVVLKTYIASGVLIALSGLVVTIVAFVIQFFPKSWSVWTIFGLGSALFALGLISCLMAGAMRKNSFVRTVYLVVGTILLVCTVTAVISFWVAFDTVLKNVQEHGAPDATRTQLAVLKWTLLVVSLPTQLICLLYAMMVQCKPSYVELDDELPDATPRPSYRGREDRGKVALSSLSSFAEKREAQAMAARSNSKKATPKLSSSTSSKWPPPKADPASDAVWPPPKGEDDSVWPPPKSSTYV
eukprot:jgi/Mesvir1/5957/Mv00714-RA.1